MKRQKAFFFWFFLFFFESEKKKWKEKWAGEAKVHFGPAGQASLVTIVTGRPDAPDASSNLLGSTRHLKGFCIGQASSIDHRSTKRTTHTLFIVDSAATERRLGAPLLSKSGMKATRLKLYTVKWCIFFLFWKINYIFFFLSTEINTCLLSNVGMNHQHISKCYTEYITHRLIGEQTRI